MRYIGNDGTIRRDSAVSYTHLDVYKRQPLLNKKRSIPEPTRDEPIRRDQAPPTPTPIVGTKRGGGDESSDDEEPPPPREITGPKRGG